MTRLRMNVFRGVPRKVEPEDLDSPFEMAEAKRALKHLRPGGAHGGDNVPPECKYLTGAFIYLTWFMLQLWWSAEMLPAEYDTTPLWPVYKDGDPTDPKNYRGISLLTVFYKLFESVLAYRLYCSLKDCRQESALTQTKLGTAGGSGPATTYTY